MLAELTVKNQLTLPKAVAKQFAEVEYFDVSTDCSTVRLKPNDAQHALILFKAAPGSAACSLVLNFSQPPLGVQQLPVVQRPHFVG
jgi:hypothetical protein